MSLIVLPTRGTMGRMHSSPLHTTPTRRGSTGRSTSTTEYEFQRLTLSRDFSKSFVTRLLVDRAERGGWELDRVRVLHDGTRKIVLRRKIIRQRAAAVYV